MSSSSVSMHGFLWDVQNHLPPALFFDVAKTTQKFAYATLGRYHSSRLKPYSFSCSHLFSFNQDCQHCVQQKDEQVGPVEVTFVDPWSSSVFNASFLSTWLNALFNFFVLRRVGCSTLSLFLLPSRCRLLLAAGACFSRRLSRRIRI